MSSTTIRRTVDIGAEPATVWRMVSESDGFAKWLGAGSSIDPTIGGTVRIAMPGGVAASGKVTVCEAPRRIAFTYGYDAGAPFPSGATLVEIALNPMPNGGTTVTLTHSQIPSEELGQAHIGGWRHCLAVLAHQSCGHQAPTFQKALDAYYAAWGKQDLTAIRDTLATCLAPDAEFRDPHGVTVGIDELAAHIDAVHRFMAGVELKTEGTPSLCHTQALSVWLAKAGPNTVARGHNVIDFTPSGLIQRVTGHWG